MYSFYFLNSFTCFKRPCTIFKESLMIHGSVAINSGDRFDRVVASFQFHDRP